MAKANKTRYALLGVLSYQPSSGYDIKKICDNSIGYFWNENYGHICPVLKQLESENLITKFVKETEGHPQKNIYSITEKGTEELKNWLTQPIDKVPARSELLLKIFFSANIPTKDIIKMLEDNINDYNAKLDSLKQVETLLKAGEYEKYGGKKDLALWTITVRNGLIGIKALIDWRNESIETLRSLDE